MYTSANKTALIYLLAAIFCALFGAVYEVFSHGVYSYAMLYAFGYPLVGGALPFLALSVFRPKKYPHGFARNLYHSGIVTLTVGSILQGILEIYGTTNALINYYTPVGILLLTVGILIYFLQPVDNSPETK